MAAEQRPAMPIEIDRIGPGCDATSSIWHLLQDAAQTQRKSQMDPLPTPAFSAPHS